MSKKFIITIISLAIGALHFLTGEHYQGPFPLFVNGYLIDILLPMMMVLLMGLMQSKILQAPLFRASAVFLFGCAVETSQYLGRPFFGSTFDPLDILAYASGIGLGLFLDLVLFPRLVPSRNEKI